MVAQLHVVNGWQNVSETNADKAVGTRIDWQVRPNLMIGWRTFVGNEQPDSVASRVRTLQQLVARSTPPGWDWSLVLDAGRQGRGGSGNDSWNGGALIGRRALSSRTWLAGRVDALTDPDRVLVAAPDALPFRTRSASLGIDVQMERRAWWRTEVRGFRSTEAIWPSAGGASGGRHSGLLVSSLAITF